MPKHQATSIRRGPWCLWAMARCHLGTLLLIERMAGQICPRFCCAEYIAASHLCTSKRYLDPPRTIGRSGILI
jgi:hypothetical protein